MRETNGARAATGEHPGTPDVAPRFTRAVKAERARLEGKRVQLLRKREAAQAEVARIDRAVEATDELLELLAPLLAATGSEPSPPTTTAPRALSPTDPHRSSARRVSAIERSADRPRCERDRPGKHNQRKE